MAPLEGVGRDYPLSIEKLCPVLSFYVVKDWREGCERCKQILRYGGMGHTMSIHSQDEAIILEFGLKKPAFRIVVNTPTAHGSIGLTTGLDPAMTLGCGGYGGNITSDNISPRHLLNIKRLAYEVAPAVSRFERQPGSAVKRPTQAPHASTGISADALSRRIDEFLGSRGFKAVPRSEGNPSRPRSELQERPDESATPAARNDGAAWPAEPSSPLDFVCEEDVRTAIQAGRKLVVSERAIVTPAARDLGEQHHIFTPMPWRG
jgi:acetaldehyde dehydrogenase (acetylating)